MRDWLCGALLPMAGRDERRRAVADRVRDDLARSGRLPAEAAATHAGWRKRCMPASSLPA